MKQCFNFSTRYKKRIITETLSYFSCAPSELYSCALSGLCFCAPSELCSCALSGLCSCALSELGSCALSGLCSCALSELGSCALSGLCSCAPSELGIWVYLRMESSYFYQQIFRRNSYADKEFQVAEYEDCTFEECSWDAATFEGCTFIECTFKACRIINPKMDNSQWQTVLFQDCQLLGVHFSDCNPFLFSIRVSGCQIQYGSYHQMDLKESQFMVSQLLEVDFVEADLREVSFPECDLTGSQFDNSNLEGSNFRSATGIMIDPTKNAIRGAKFTISQLPGLLQSFGIEIEL